MIEDDTQEVVAVYLTKAQAARIYDKARQSRSGWEEMAKEDLTSTKIPVQYRHHTANQAAEWRDIEQIFAEAVGGNSGLKRVKKIIGVRRI